jgi:hypothetical protein
MTHKKGEIVDEIENALPVNMLRGIPLEICYYLANNRVYKKLCNGKFRVLVKQESRPEYQHYFFRDKDKKKLTLNVNKLNLLTYSADVVNEEKEEQERINKEYKKEEPHSDAKD